MERTTERTYMAEIKLFQTVISAQGKTPAAKLCSNTTIDVALLTHIFLLTLHSAGSIFFLGVPLQF